MNDNDVVSHLIQMLSVHENAFIMKALSLVVLESSKIKAFLPDLLNDTSLSIFLNKLLNYQGEPDRLSNKFDYHRNIIQKTKIPIKYLIYTSIFQRSLMTTRSNGCQFKKKICLPKLHSYNIKFLIYEEEMIGDGKS